METISDSEFRKAQSIALEKLRKKNLMGLLAAQRDGTLQEFVKPELEAYVRRVHPGKSLPQSFQSSETSQEISYRRSESDVTPIAETSVATNPQYTRKNSLPASTTITAPAAAVQSKRATPSTQPPIAPIISNETTQATIKSESSSISPIASNPPEEKKRSSSTTTSTTAATMSTSSSSSSSSAPAPTPTLVPTPGKLAAPTLASAAPVPVTPNKFQSKKPVSSGLAARMAALNSQNDSQKSQSSPTLPIPMRPSSTSPPPQIHVGPAGSSSQPSRAKRLRSDAEYGGIMNVNLYRPTMLHNPEIHRKKSGSRRLSLISGKDFPLVSIFSDDDTSSNSLLRRKSLPSMDHNTLIQAHTSPEDISHSVTNISTITPSFQIQKDQNMNQDKNELSPNISHNVPNSNEEIVIPNAQGNSETHTDAHTLHTVPPTNLQETTTNLETSGRDARSDDDGKSDVDKDKNKEVTPIQDIDSTSISGTGTATATTTTLVDPSPPTNLEPTIPLLPDHNTDSNDSKASKNNDNEQQMEITNSNEGKMEPVDKEEDVKVANQSNEITVNTNSGSQDSHIPLQEIQIISQQDNLHEVDSTTTVGDVENISKNSEQVNKEDPKVSNKENQEHSQTITNENEKEVSSQEKTSHKEISADQSETIHNPLSAHIISANSTPTNSSNEEKLETTPEIQETKKTTTIESSQRSPLHHQESGDAATNAIGPDAAVNAGSSNANASASAASGESGSSLSKSTSGDTEPTKSQPPPQQSAPSCCIIL